MPPVGQEASNIHSQQPFGSTNLFTIGEGRAGRGLHLPLTTAGSAVAGGGDGMQVGDTTGTGAGADGNVVSSNGDDFVEAVPVVAPPLLLQKKDSNGATVAAIVLGLLLTGSLGGCAIWNRRNQQHAQPAIGEGEIHAMVENPMVAARARRETNDGAPPVPDAARPNQRGNGGAADSDDSDDVPGGVDDYVEPSPHQPKK